MPLESRCMASRLFFASVIMILFLCAAPSAIRGQTPAQNEKSPDPSSKVAAPRQGSPAKQPSPEEQLQQAVSNAGNDRAALVRNLEAYLKDYPDSRQRPQIYRALVEASLQLRDNARAADYAERMVALNPNDISTLLLAIELLEQQKNEAALRRAVNYSTRVLEAVNRTSADGRSPRVSAEQWELEKKSDLANTYFLRGDLCLKLKDYAAAKNDLLTSYQTFPTAGAAQRLGETAELQNDLNSAIQEYARAFALAEGKNGNVSRSEIRKKLGNVWRLAHGSDIGLGEYLLLTYDEVSRGSTVAKPKKNADAREPSDFTLRKAPDGSAFSLKDTKGKIIVVNFWATWCGPCHALEPLFARVAADFQANPDVLFLAADCDEDESLVKGYLEEDKPRTAVVFADGLDRFLNVNSFPTVMVIDRDGKIAYRSDGFEPDTFEPNLTAAVRRALAPPTASFSISNPAP
jgi:thiol-disulfide isomerase/thioredoxin